MAYNKDTDMYEGYIYCIENTITNMKYIGQTTQDVQTRWRGHCGDARNGDHKRLYTSMRYYGIDAFSVSTLECISCLNKDELKRILNDREKHYISFFDSYNNGYNNTTGGQDATEHICRAVVQYDLNGNYINIYHSVQDLCEVLKRDCISSIYSNCYGEIAYAYGYVWRYEGDEFNKFTTPNVQQIKASRKREMIKVTQVCQYALDGELICIFTNATEAAKVLNIQRGTIINSCNGKGTAGGYIFRFVDDSFDAYRTHFGKSKKVYQYTKDGKFVAEYSSSREAGRALGLSGSQVSAACNGRRKSASGYVWSYIKF